jgi:hypothetical protein
MKSVRFIVLWYCLAARLYAGSPSSASYTIVGDVIDLGGQRTTSATYVNIGSAGGISGMAGAPLPGITVKAGYVAQVVEVTALVLTASGATLNEGGNGQIAAWQQLDDATFLAVPAASVGWSITPGPLTTISASGLVSAGAVFQDTPATLQGVFASHTGTFSLTVRNTNPDNFSTFANDGLDDALQVRATVLAAPNADADGDGTSDLLEYAFGTSLTVASTAVIGFGGGSIIQRGLPVPWTQNVVNGVDFRAVFGRRKDYAAAGLTFTVQFSADLVTWQNSTATPTVITGDSVIDVVGVPYPFFINGRKARFFRVLVSAP